MKHFRQSFLKKSNEIFKLGYTPSRSNETYYFKFQQLDKFVITGNLSNCFSHACFNFLNQHYNDFNISDYDILAIQGLVDRSKTKEEISLKFKNFLNSAGLQVEKDSKYKILNNNEWRVALFFDEIQIGNRTIIRDYHFILQEKDKTWSSKENFSPKLNILSSLPEKYTDYYKLHDVFVLKNPEAREK